MNNMAENKCSLAFGLDLREFSLSCRGEGRGVKHLLHLASAPAGGGVAR